MVGLFYMNNEHGNIGPRVENLAGNHSPESLRAKINLLDDRVKEMLGASLDHAGYSFEQVVGPTHLGTLEPEHLKKVSSLIGDLHMYKGDLEETKLIIKKMTAVMAQ